MTRGVDNGVGGAGVSTTVLPATRAAGTFDPAVLSGVFQGVIAATTPEGRLRIFIRRCALSSSSFPLMSILNSCMVAFSKPRATEHLRRITRTLYLEIARQVLDLVEFPGSQLNRSRPEVFF